MFSLVTTLLAFVFAIALTHLFASATELMLARDRVRFSGLLALWMLNALVGLLVNWLSLYGLSSIRNWQVVDVMAQFVPAAIQYFTCSLVSLRPEGKDPIDMPAFFERHRPLIMAAFAASVSCSMIQNFLYRDVSPGTQAVWFWADVLVSPMLLSALIALWARPRWLQWAAGLAMLGLESYFLATFALTL